MASKAGQLRAARPDAAVHDQIVGPLGDVRIEIVHQHPQRGFLRPALAGQRGAARGANECEWRRHGVMTDRVVNDSDDALEKSSL